MMHTELHAAMLEAVDQEMRLVLSSAGLDPYDGLEELLAYHLGWSNDGQPLSQGKRIRPLMVLLTTAACGTDWRWALPAAASVELLHNFSLIHDDIQDQSALRRGRETLWSKVGTALAINAGDAMFNLAFIALTRLSETVPSEITLDAIRILQRACIRLTGGQHLDIAYERADSLPLASYWPMIEGKTAALLAASAQLGALVGGAGPEQQQAYYQFGFNLGLAFQVWDDCLGIWGDPAVTGKSAASDLLTGKKTFPVLHGLERGGPFAQRWKGGPISEADVEEVAALLAAEGSREYSEQEAHRLTQIALKSLDQANPKGEAGERLRALSLSLLDRTH